MHLLITQILCNLIFQQMFQKEREQIIQGYALSPRCVQQHMANRNPQLYSWKNYLNSTVDQLYNKIKSQNQTKQTQKLNFQIKNEIQRRKRVQMQQKQQTNQIRSEQQIYYDLKLQEGLTHKKSKSTLNRYQVSSQYIAPTSVKNYDKTTRISTQTNTQFQYAPKISLRQLKQKQYAKSMTGYKKVEPQSKYSSFSKKQMGVNTQKIDWYHMQLKQQERLYVLDEFIDHYEKKHKYKF